LCYRGFIATTRPLTPRAAQALFPISCAPQAPVALPRCCRWLDHLVSVLLGEDHEVSLDRLPDIQTVPRGNHNLESVLGFTPNPSPTTEGVQYPRFRLRLSLAGSPLQNATSASLSAADRSFAAKPSGPLLAETPCLLATRPRSGLGREDLHLLARQAARRTRARLCAGSPPTSFHVSDLLSPMPHGRRRECWWLVSRKPSPGMGARPGG